MRFRLWPYKVQCFYQLLGYRSQYANKIGGAYRTTGTFSTIVFKDGYRAYRWNEDMNHNRFVVNVRQM